MDNYSCVTNDRFSNRSWQMFQRPVPVLLLEIYLFSERKVHFQKHEDGNSSVTNDRKSWRCSLIGRTTGAIHEYLQIHILRCNRLQNGSRNKSTYFQKGTYRMRITLSSFYVAQQEWDRHTGKRRIRQKSESFTILMIL